MKAAEKRFESVGSYRLDSVAQMIRRAEKDGLGRNGVAAQKRAKHHFFVANSDLQIRETRGEDVTSESERYWKLLARAIDVGLVAGHYAGWTQVQMPGPVDKGDE